MRMPLDRSENNGHMVRQRLFQRLVIRRGDDGIEISPRRKLGDVGPSRMQRGSGARSSAVKTLSVCFLSNFFSDPSS